MKPSMGRRAVSMRAIPKQMTQIGSMRTKKLPVKGMKKQETPSRTKPSSARAHCTGWR